MTKHVDFVRCQKYILWVLSFLLLITGLKENRRMKNMAIFNADIIMNLGMHSLTVRSEICAIIIRKWDTLL